MIINREEKILTNSTIYNSESFTMQVKMSKHTITGLARILSEQANQSTESYIQRLAKELENTNFSDLAYVDVEGNVYSA